MAVIIFERYVIKTLKSSETEIFCSISIETLIINWDPAMKFLRDTLHVYIQIM